ncbi:S24 family peptidase [Actinomycetospora cinnamomea]|uniref:Peptidase S24-like protein n=1 Tax=Actinomycetospora cinnamomea TaxID=663609 RepID=A0A2U1FRR2_9PSEU|nr:S24 family peptidase [Actinomycetospora cinnamomea]PVZ14858.1 peptidase S24-like protein [Actinomycetospora cinnamomea]
MSGAREPLVTRVVQLVRERLRDRWRRRPRRVLVRGSSMLPTLRDGDVVVALPGAAVRPGELALVRWPARPGQLSVKRAALAFDDGWFALGDAPAASTDSRTLGPAEALGPVRWRLWPHPARLRAR